MHVVNLHNIFKPVQHVTHATKPAHGFLQQDLTIRGLQAAAHLVMMVLRQKVNHPAILKPVPPVKAVTAQLDHLWAVLSLITQELQAIVPVAIMVQKLKVNLLAIFQPVQAVKLAIHKPVAF